MNPCDLIRVPDMGIEAAVSEGLTDLVRKYITEKPGLVNHRYTRETACSPYRDYGPAEYEDCESILVTAIDKGWKDIALYLIDKGADVNFSCKTSHGDEYSVMKSCKEYGDEDILKALVEHGAVDDGSPLQHKHPYRGSCEREYGRSGNLIASLFSAVANDIRSKRTRDYTKAARAMADREMYKLIDKVLSMLECPSMEAFIRHHEEYVPSVSKMAREDYEFLMKDSEMSYGTYINFLEDCSARMQWRFIVMAIKHAVLWNKQFTPEFSPDAKPVLKDFCRETYGDFYNPEEDRPLLGVYERFYKKYLALFPAEDLKASVNYDTRYEDYRDFEKVHRNICHFTANFRTDWEFDWNWKNTID